MDVTPEQASVWLRDAVELRRDRTTIAVALHEVAQWFGLTDVRASKIVYRQINKLRDSECDTFPGRYALFLHNEAARRVLDAQRIAARAAELEQRISAQDRKVVHLRQRRAAFGRELVG